MLMRYRRTQDNEKGFASLIVALVLILVLSLLTIGFAQLARREQQISLSKQLSSQAFYAAEAGINDALKALPQILAAIEAGDNIPEDQCLGPPFITNNVVNSANDVTYSCVLVNTQLPSIEYGAVEAGSTRSITYSLSDGLESLTVSWGSADNQTEPRTASGLPPLSDWDSPAVLQFSLTPLSNLDRQSLIDRTFTAYLYPWGSGFGSSNVPYKPANAPGDKVPFVSGNCTDSGKYACSVTVTGIGGALGDRYLVHLTNLYDTSNIAIGAKSINGIPLKFIKGQATIDVTGKAHNVLKRVRVNVPLDKKPSQPDGAIQSQSICKRFDVEPTSPAFYYTTTDASCELDNN